MNIGIFGGTFDPIHIGHLIVAEEARYKLGLDKVVFLPAGRPWFKSDRTITSGKARLEMIRLGIKDNPHFEVSELELNRDGPTYSVDSIPALKQQYDGADNPQCLDGRYGQEGPKHEAIPDETGWFRRRIGW